MSKHKKIQKYYDEYSSWYDDERIDSHYRFINEIETDLVRELGSNKKTLEIGCGTGIILHEVDKCAKQAWGIDLSIGMLKRAKEKELNVKQASATKLPFKDKEFDVIYSLKVLAHIPEITEVISEVKRVVKDDGYALLEFYNPWSVKFLSNLFFRSRKRVYVRFDSLRDIKKLLKGNFKVVGVRGAKIFVPFPFLFKIPILNKILARLEKLLSKTILNRFAGYLIVIAKKI